MTPLTLYSVYTHISVLYILTMYVTATRIYQKVQARFLLFVYKKYKTIFDMYFSRKFQVKFLADTSKQGTNKNAFVYLYKSM